jgi:hypothetical protein
MPFTISHAAVALPFARLLARWRLLSAVIIGAMVPDFGLFFPWHVYRFETHSFVALWTFCLPVGAFTYWVFQYLIKTPLYELLPDGAYARWQPFAPPAEFSSPRQWLLCACGLLLGAVSHLVWDAFTHENARGVRMIPWIEDPAVDIGSHHVSGVRLLQDGSSLMGLIIVLGFIAYALRQGRERPVPNRPLRAPERWLWVAIYLLAALGATVAWLIWARVGEPATRHSVIALATGIAVAALRGLAVALLGTSIVLTLRLRGAR